MAAMVFLNLAPPGSLLNNLMIPGIWIYTYTRIHQHVKIVTIVVLVVNLF
jgi:hypothetical protein